jgi:hypothetical protein
MMNDVTAFSPKTLGFLLRTDAEKTMAKYAIGVTEFILDRLRDNMNESTGCALFFLLFTSWPHAIGPALAFVVDFRGLASSFKLKIISMGVRWMGSSLDGIPRYVISTFNKGGMHLVGQLLVTQPDVGLYLFIKGAAKAAFLMAMKDLENVRAYVWFIQLGFVTLVERDVKLAKKFGPCVFRFGLHIIEKWGKDRSNGIGIVWHCIRVMKNVLELNGKKLLEKVYGEMTGEEREGIVKIVLHHMEVEIQTKKMQTLVEFSAHERGNRHGSLMEWTSLEME